MRNVKYTMLLLMLGTPHAGACDLQITAAWIREAPPVATTLAGYARLFNAGTRPLRIVAIESPLFPVIELHESLRENGVAQMRPVKALDIAPGGSVVLQPDGKHLMLMNPAKALGKNDKVVIRMKDDRGCETQGEFVVAAQAP